MTEEQEQDWLFTFGYGHEHPNQYIVIKGTFGSAREEMFRRFGSKWAFQYAFTERGELHKHGILEV